MEMKSEQGMAERVRAVVNRLSAQRAKRGSAARAASKVPAAAAERPMQPEAALVRGETPATWKTVAEIDGRRNVEKNNNYCT